MQKFKIPVLVVGALLLAIAIYIFFIKSSSVYSAIPKSTVAVLEVKNWLQFADKLITSFAGLDTKKIDGLQKLFSEILVMENLLSSDKSLKQEITSGKTVVSLHLISADDYDFLFTTQLEGVNDNTILNRVQSSPNMRSVKVRIFKNQKIVDVILKDGKQMSFAKLNDILVFSFTSFLTENSMTAMLTGDNLNSDKNFKSVCKKFTTSSDALLYFNFQKADVILPVVFKAEKISLLNDLTSTGSWARYEINLDHNKMEWSGTIANEKASETRETKNVLEQTIVTKVPDNAAYTNISKRGNGDTMANALLHKYFGGWIGDTKAFVILEPLKEDFTEQNVFITTIKNKNKATESLRALIAADGTEPFPFDTFLNQEIYMLKSGIVINQVFGNRLVNFKNTFFAIQNDAAIFCNNADVLKMVLEKISKGETLDKDKNYLNTSASRFLMNEQVYYFNNQRSDLLVRGLLKENSTAIDFLSSFKNIIAFSSPSAKEISSHIIFNATGEKVISSGLLWKTKLQTLSNFAPQVLPNIEGGNEIFVQDTDNTVYLLNQSGGIIFSRNTEEPVLGKVAQLDYYNNGHQQLVFNTTNHVFIIDRMGNDVASYPLRLSATANCGMTLAQDEATKQFRYFIPCTNGNIYGYEANGKPLGGWSPKGGAGVLSQPLYYFTNGKNSYVLTFSTVGNLSMFDTKGNIKWSVNNLPVSTTNFSLVKSKNDFLLLNASAYQLTEISSDGNDNIKPLIDSANSFAAIATSDSTYTYFFSTNNQIRSYNNKGEFLNSSSSTIGSMLHLELISTDNQNYLLVGDSANGNYLLYDLNLKLQNEFKITPATKFSISNLFNHNEWIQLAVDARGNIACYRLK